MAEFWVLEGCVVFLSLVLLVLLVERAGRPFQMSFGLGGLQGDSLS